MCRLTMQSWRACSPQIGSVNNEDGLRGILVIGPRNPVAKWYGVVILIGAMPKLYSTKIFLRIILDIKFDR